jgi:hypothetical protein
VFGTGLGGGWKRGGCANSMGGELDKGGLVPRLPGLMSEEIMPDRRPPGNWIGRSKFPDHRWFKDCCCSWLIGGTGMNGFTPRYEGLLTGIGWGSGLGVVLGIRIGNPKFGPVEGDGLPKMPLFCMN